MKKKLIWLVVSCLMALSLVLASCGGEEEEEEEVTVPAEEEEVVIPTEEEEEEVVVPTGKPEYGGVVTIALPGDIRTFDERGDPGHGGAHTVKLTNQELVAGDWARGAAGTGEADWTASAYGGLQYMTGMLAESWEIPEVGTIIFNIRRGVHYALDPTSEASRFVNGREVTAQDVADCLEAYRTTPGSAAFFAGFVHATVTAPDEWTAKIVLPPEYFEDASVTIDYHSIYPPELWERYGDLTDWRNSVGSGPFILKDFIPGSSATLVRNPDYWEKDPVGPGKGSDLPYLDGVEYLIIPDLSTRLSALRTGKVDILLNVSWEDAESLKKTSPELKYKKYYAAGEYGAIGMRTDKPDLPFKDKRVRHALMMATDFETIKDTICGGEAQILSWPITYVKEYAGAYLPLEETSEAVQELYVYNPERAKQLLAQAGYPGGFKTTIVCQSIPSEIDYISVIKDMWSKVGIELVIDPKEPGAFFGYRASREYDEMIYGAGGLNANLYIAAPFDGTTAFGNLSHISDPVVKEAVSGMLQWSLIDPTKANQIHKELMPYVLEQAWAIPRPSSPMYNYWQAWVKNYHGEDSLGRSNSYSFCKYIWIDEDLKKSMGH